MSDKPAGDNFRPEYHFTPTRNWMNDPNGLVYLDGEYHLFYQYNPTAPVWGNIGWGHAVSRNLSHWTDLGEALPATAQGMVFSGSAVVDQKNTSRLGNGDSPVIVALYTLHSSKGGRTVQAQHLAWSIDRGRSWQQYDGNPVLDIGSDAFRDPKVFWHEESGRWIMAVVLANEHKVQFYCSNNLLRWQYLSSFGPCGNTEGEWECPDLFQLPIEDQPDSQKWVLKVDCTLGSQAGGSGGQYFVGDFDGTLFQADSRARPVDYGSDFYAAMTWSNLPADGRSIWLAWMSNWQYAAVTPTQPFRGVQSIPRTVHLLKTKNDLQLAQRPVAELRELRTRNSRYRDIDLAAGESLRPEDSNSETLELRICVAVGPDAVIAVKLHRSDGSLTTVSFDNRNNELAVDRRRTASPPCHASFPACHRAPLHAVDGSVDINILLDHSCLEVFGGRGETVITDLLFPDGAADGIEIHCERGSAAIRQLDIWHLDV